ncbi:hypothetical protein D3C80_2199710 [compost metagenome]
MQAVDRQGFELQGHALAAGEALQERDGIAFSGLSGKGAVIGEVVLAFQADAQRLRLADAESQE